MQSQSAGTWLSGEAGPLPAELHLEGPGHLKTPERGWRGRWAGAGQPVISLWGPGVDRSPGRRPPSWPWRRRACLEQIRGADCPRGEASGCHGGDWSQGTVTARGRSERLSQGRLFMEESDCPWGKARGCHQGDWSRGRGEDPAPGAPSLWRRRWNATSVSGFSGLFVGRAPRPGAPLQGALQAGRGGVRRPGATRVRPTRDPGRGCQLLPSALAFLPFTSEIIDTFSLAF